MSFNPATAAGSIKRLLQVAKNVALQQNLANSACDMRTITYAIGDIHGRLDLLEQLLGLIENEARTLAATAKIVITGD